MSRVLRQFLPLLLTMALVACGGGGSGGNSDSTDPVTPPPPEGGPDTGPDNGPDNEPDSELPPEPAPPPSPASGAEVDAGVGVGSDDTPARVPEAALPPAPELVDAPLVDEPAIDPGIDDPASDAEALDDTTRSLLDSAESVVQAVLISLNARLAAGEGLDASEQSCLAAYDQALGRAATELLCDPALVLPEGRLRLTVGVLQDSEACQADLMQGLAARCPLTHLDLRVPSRFIVPEIGVPQPTVGGIVRLRIDDDNSLTIENDVQPLTGSFFCQFNLDDGQASALSDPFGNCEQQIAALHQQIEAALALLAEPRL